MACVNGWDSELNQACGGGPTGATGATGSTNPANPFAVPVYNINPTISRYRAETDRLQYELALRKFEEEQERLKEELRVKNLGAQEQFKYYSDLLADPTAFRKPTQDYLDLVSKYETTAKENVGSEYNAVGEALTKAYNAGVTLSTNGINALKTYLTTNQPIAFANAQRATVQPQVNLIEQYARQRGIATPGVQQAVQEANVLAEGGAQNYNNLLNILNTLGQRGQTSRQAEAEMLGQVVSAQLAGRNLSAQTNLERQRAQALAQLASQFNATRLQAEASLLARRQAIEDALAKLRATGVIPPDTKNPNLTGPTKPTGATSPAVAPSTYVPPGAEGLIAPGFTSPQTEQSIIDALIANAQTQAPRGPVDPATLVAALAQQVAPEYLEGRLMGSAGNPMFGALDRSYFV